MLFPPGLNNHSSGVQTPYSQTPSLPQPMPQSGQHPVMQGPGGPPTYFLPTGQPYQSPVATSDLPPNALNRDQLHQFVTPPQPGGTNFIPAPGHYPPMDTNPNAPPQQQRQQQTSAFKSGSAPAAKGLQKDLIGGQRRTNADSKIEATASAKPTQKGALGWIRAKANAFGNEVKALGRSIQKNSADILGSLGATALVGGFVAGVILVAVGLGTGAFPLLLAGIIILTPYALAAMATAPVYVII